MGIADRLSLPDAEPWKPEVGDQVIGTVVGIDERTGGEWGPYPVITIETNGGEVAAVHAFHSVLKNEVERVQVGDEIGIVYRGMKQGAKQSYENYKVVIERNGAPAAQASLAAHAAAAQAELADVGASTDEEPF